MIELIFQKELMLIRQIHQKSVIFVITGIFYTNMNHIFAVAIVSVRGSDYRIHFWYMSKADAINILKNSNLNKKSEIL